MDGAGGVGGLLWVTLHAASGVAAGTHFAAYDGNGNVVGLVSATTGTETARYEYGPFGEPIRVTGTAANQNSFRFSIKRTCNTTDLVLYEYRGYNPSIGRWLSRDPYWESGGMNLYGFVGNAQITYFDVLGLWRSYEHRSLTQIAWKNARLLSELVGNAAIYRTIEDANIAVDSGASANDLRRHYNRGLSENIAFARQRYSEWLRLRQTSFNNLLEHPSKSACELALKAIGELTHSWEDYYAHAIGVNSPFRGNPGPIEGNPDAPSTNLKPSSWGGYFDWGEHGNSEPAWREADRGADRATKASDFVAGKFRSEMPRWWRACHCFYGYH